MVLAIALDHLAVGVEFEALVTRLAYPGSHAVSIDPLVDRVSDAVADGVISPARPFGGETPNASARELFLALISSDRPPYAPSLQLRLARRASSPTMRAYLAPCQRSCPGLPPVYRIGWILRYRTTLGLFSEPVAGIL